MQFVVAVCGGSASQQCSAEERGMLLDAQLPGFIHTCNTLAAGPTGTESGFRQGTDCKAQGDR